MHLGCTPEGRHFSREAAAVWAALIFGGGVHNVVAQADVIVASQSCHSNRR
jgi:hypothetical protein